MSQPVDGSLAPDGWPCSSKRVSSCSPVAVGAELFRSANLVGSGFGVNLGRLSTEERGAFTFLTACRSCQPNLCAHVRKTPFNRRAIFFASGGSSSGFGLWRILDLPRVGLQHSAGVSRNGDDFGARLSSR